MTCVTIIKSTNDIKHLSMILSNNLDLNTLEPLTILEAKSLIGFTSRISFQVVEPCNGYGVGDICVFICVKQNTQLLNLSGYANMIIDKFNINLMKSLKLRPIKVIASEISEDFNYGVVKPGVTIKPFQSELDLSDYITRAFLLSNFKKLQDSKYTKDHVIKFLELLITKSLKDR